MSNAKIRSLDLTVLLVFLGLLRHGKASRAAAEIGLTQPAVSHALRRLRAVFGDPLFLRRPHGMEPTAVARTIEPQVAAAVEALRQAVAGAAPFDPSAAQREIRISAWDSAQTLLAPGLAARLLAEAPGLRVAFRTLDRDAAIEALDTSAIDLAVGYFPAVPPQALATALYNDTYAVVGIPDVLPERLTLDDYLALPHVLVTPRGDATGMVDRTLAGMGLERRIVAAVPQLLAAFATVAETGAIATVPARLARHLAPLMGLRTAPPPFALPPVPVVALRHRRNERDGCLVWIAGALRDLSAGAG